MTASGALVRRDASHALRKRNTPSDAKRSAKRRVDLVVPDRKPNASGVEARINRYVTQAQPSSREVTSKKVASPTSEREEDEIKMSAVSEEVVTTGLFEGSSIALCSADGKSIKRSISIAAPLALKMKSHQIEGIKFMWENLCSDLASASSYEEAKAENCGGGAILAHFMGLGKTAGKYGSEPFFPLNGYWPGAHPRPLSHRFTSTRAIEPPLS